jgi:hypothetical protein
MTPNTGGTVGLLGINFEGLDFVLDCRNFACRRFFG